MDANIEQVHVLDASFFLAYLLPDENVSQVQAFFDQYKSQKMNIVAPALLPFEVLNGLLAAVLTKRTTPAVVKELAEKFLQIPVKLEEIDFAGVLNFSLVSKLSFYDASYLYLARKYQAELLSLDRRLLKHSPSPV